MLAETEPVLARAPSVSPRYALAGEGTVSGGEEGTGTESVFRDANDAFASPTTSFSCEL